MLPQENEIMEHIRNSNDLKSINREINELEGQPIGDLDMYLDELTRLQNHASYLQMRLNQLEVTQ